MAKRLTVTDVPIGSRYNRLVTTSAPYVVDQRRSHVDVQCDCGTIMAIPVYSLRNGNTKSCGCLRSDRHGSRNPNFKGGWTKTSGGYLHFGIARPDGRRQNISQHHLTMEEHLGRALLSHEEVHHKNGIRDDNDWSNLELWTTSQPRGQRVEDKVAWALDFLSQYGYELAA
jgi:hypothetical protein